MGKRILIVDDEPEIRKALTCRLAGDGFIVETAKSGWEAIGACICAMENEPYDLIVLDIMMPEVDGMEVLKLLRKEEEYRGIKLGDGTPVIMLTALEERWMDSFKCGYDDFLTKPYMPHELLNKIHQRCS